MEARIQGGEIKDILKDTIQENKDAICMVMPSMKDAAVLDILRSIKDQHAWQFTHSLKNRGFVGGNNSKWRQNYQIITG